MDVVWKVGLSLVYTGSRRQKLRVRMRTVGKAVGEYERLLSARDPEKVLARGYALVEGPDGRLVRDVDSVEVGQTLKTRLHTGTIVSTVTGKEY